jgi:hypothetical protein
VSLHIRCFPAAYPTLYCRWWSCRLFWCLSAGCCRNDLRLQAFDDCIIIFMLIEDTKRLSANRALLINAANVWLLFIVLTISAFVIVFQKLFGLYCSRLQLRATFTGCGPMTRHDGTVSHPNADSNTCLYGRFAGQRINRKYTQSGAGTSPLGMFN